MSGDPNKPAEIQQRANGYALFINEHGSQAWGSIDRGTVWIPEWSSEGSQGLFGVVRGDRIVWPNGSFWSRNPRW
jgi:hypothetical protein